MDSPRHIDFGNRPGVGRIFMGFVGSLGTSLSMGFGGENKLKYIVGNSVILMEASQLILVTS
jgi:hypothetical protein